MTTTSTQSGLGASPGGEGVRVIQVPPDLRLSAASRLIGEQGGDPLLAAQRFLESASLLRVDLDLLWCTTDERPASGGREGSGEGGGVVGVRQVVLAVIGTGRTAMLFVSGTEKRSRHWPGAAKLRLLASAPIADARRERIALIHHACERVAAPGADGRPRAVLAQALLEQRETEAGEALVGAGFTRLGELMYMRRQLPRSGPGRALEQAGSPEWPAGVRVRSLRELAEEGHTTAQIDAWLADALDRSYIDTQDCPELCGLRAMSDVMDSHRSVGVFDPSLWWIALDASERAVGCLLLSVCPEQDSVELVYLGLAPDVRGCGLGSKLLLFGLRRLYDGPLAAATMAGSVQIGGTGGVTCAVDSRNAAAVKLYRRAGFERFGVRVPFVRSLRAPDA
jgi:ribosomal protein S18 acetylase RimI-like enzyme